jgi:hypothetical protein
MSEKTITGGFHGIVLYDIQSNGYLNGVFSNFPNKGSIQTETARPDVERNDKVITGMYDSFYFDTNGTKNNCKLEIKPIRINSFSFEWKNPNGGNFFEGVGYKMNEKQIAVHYWQ